MSLTLLPKGPFAGTWIFASCDTVNVAYHCFTHDEDFPHRQALSQHVAAAPDEQHDIAPHCPTHRVFEAIDRKPEPKPEAAQP